MIQTLAIFPRVLNLTFADKDRSLWLNLTFADKDRSLWLNLTFADKDRSLWLNLTFADKDRSLWLNLTFADKDRSLWLNLTFADKDRSLWLNRRIIIVFIMSKLRCRPLRQILLAGRIPLLVSHNLFCCIRTCVTISLGSFVNEITLLEPFRLLFRIPFYIRRTIVCIIRTASFIRLLVSILSVPSVSTCSVSPG